MIVKEFIEKVADGTFTDIDIIEYVSQKEDIKSVLRSLFMSDIVVIESTGKPQITDVRQKARIINAMYLIGEKFHVSWLDEDDPINITKDVFNKLHGEYFDMDYPTLCYFMRNKKLPDGRDRYLWKGRAVDAIRFADYYGIEISELQKAFYVHNRNREKREIDYNDRKLTTQSKLTDILKSYSNTQK